MHKSNPSQVAQATGRLLVMKALYVLTAVIGGSAGLLILLDPPTAKRIIGFPTRLPDQDPIVFGMLGAMWLGIAAVSVLGFRAPLKFASMFLVQLVYKSLWFMFVFIPLMVQGDFPAHGWLIAVGNAIWIAMDLAAIPYRYLFSDALSLSDRNGDRKSYEAVAAGGEAG